MLQEKNAAVFPAINQQSNDTLHDIVLSESFLIPYHSDLITCLTYLFSPRALKPTSPECLCHIGFDKRSIVLGSYVHESSFV